MTSELKVILDGYIQWCRENNQEPCVISVTDINMKNINRLCDMHLSIHPPDLEQYTQRTATEAADIFIRIVKDMSESTGIDREIVFRDLLQFVSGPDDIQSLVFSQNVDQTAVDFMWACTSISGRYSRDSQ